MDYNNVLISFVIPVYNVETYLEQTVRSIIEQDLSSYEIILVDDGSIDHSLSIAKSLADIYKNIIVLHQENQGATYARNLGFSKATGKYVMFFDSDDCLMPGTISPLLMKLIDGDYDMSISSYDIVSENLNLVQEIRYDENLQISLTELFCLIPFPGNKIFKRDIILKNGLCFDPVRIGQDLNFYLKYLPFAKNILISSMPITQYRVLKSSISNSIDDRILDIISSFKYVEDYYYFLNVNEAYMHSLFVCKYKHLVFQFSKTRRITNSIKRNTIMKVFVNEIKQTNNCIKNLTFDEYQFIFKIYLSYLKTKLVCLLK